MLTLGLLKARPCNSTRDKSHFRLKTRGMDGEITALNTVRTEWGRTSAESPADSLIDKMSFTNAADSMNSERVMLYIVKFFDKRLILSFPVLPSLSYLKLKGPNFYEFTYRELTT